jgi:hypothetical protein
MDTVKMDSVCVQYYSFLSEYCGYRL